MTAASDSVRLGDRYGAGVIDVVVSGLLAAMASDLITRAGGAVLPAVLLAIAVVTIAGGLLDAYGPGTLGRLIAGLAVRAPNGHRPSLQRAAARWLVPVSCVALGMTGAYGWIGIGLLLATVDALLLSRTGRSAFDRLTGTVVVRPPRMDVTVPGFALLDSAAPLRRLRRSSSTHHD